MVLNTIGLGEKCQDSSTTISRTQKEENLDVFFSVYADDLTTLAYSRRILLKLTCSFEVARFFCSDFRKNLRLWSLRVREISLEVNREFFYD